MSGTSPKDATRADQDPSSAGTRRRCAICGRPSDSRHAPFCSHRCQLIDLKRWFGEEYRLPADESERRLPGEAEEGEN